MRTHTYWPLLGRLNAQYTNNSFHLSYWFGASPAVLHLFRISSSPKLLQLTNLKYYRKGSRSKPKKKWKTIKVISVSGESGFPCRHTVACVRMIIISFPIVCMQVIITHFYFCCKNIFYSCSNCHCALHSPGRYLFSLKNYVHSKKNETHKKIWIIIHVHISCVLDACMRVCAWRQHCWHIIS